MKPAFIQSKLFWGGVALSAVLLGGVALKHRNSAAISPSTVVSPISSNVAQPTDPNQILAGVETMTHPSVLTATDKEMAKWFAKAKANSGDSVSWVNLGDTLMQKARETANPAYYDHAEQVYRNALNFNAQNSDAMVGLAWVNGERHVFDKSIEWANKALTVNSKNNFAYGLLGDAQVELGDYEGAFKSLQTMLDIRPDLSSYSRGAYLLSLTGDNRKARWLMDKAIKSGAPYAENTAWCRAQLGQILLSDGNLLVAEQELTKAIKLTPYNVQVLAAMAKVKTARKDYLGAIALYQKINAQTPQHNATVAIGDLYILLGDKANADKTYAEVIALHERNKGTAHDHMQLAQFYADHDQNPVEAVRLAEEHKTTQNVFEADILAWAYYQNGQYEEAQKAIMTATRYHTPDAKMIYHAGMIALKRNDRPNGRKLISQALSVNPDAYPLMAQKAAATLKELGETPGNEPPVANATQPNSALPSPEKPDPAKATR